jgi:hypothetical protein
VDINVNVTQAGAYKISTDLQNGVFLSDSGTFTNTGINTIRLKPSGTFFTHDPTLFTFSFDTTSCTFTINVQDSTGTGLGGNNGGDTTGLALNTWKFTANGHVYSGDIIIASLVPTIGITLVINGSMQSGSTDTAFGISVQFPSSVDTNSYAGLYPTSDAGTNFLLAKFPSNDVIFAANAIEPEVINIKISSYDKNTKVMKGSFSGNSYDFTGNTVPITDGAFSAHLQ